MAEQNQNVQSSASENNQIFIVKARFRADNLDLYGQMIIVLTNDGAPESSNVIISSNSETYNMELHTNWDAYEEFIADLKWKGSLDIGLTTSLTSSFDGLQADTRAYKTFYKSVKEYNYNELDVQLHDMISIVLHEHDILLESVIQEITPEEYSLVKNNRKVAAPTKSKQSDPSADFMEAENISDDAIILQAKAVLSPVKGKPIYNLKIGDKIMIKITDSSPRQNAYIKLMGLIDESNGSIKAIPADVIDLKFGMGKDEVFEVITKIEEGLFARIVETEKQVKLRMYNPASDGPLSEVLPARNIAGEEKVYAKKRSSDSSTKVFLIILAIFLIGMVGTFLYLLLLW